MFPYDRFGGVGQTILVLADIRKGARSSRIISWGSSGNRRKAWSREKATELAVECRRSKLVAVLEQLIVATE